MKAFLGPYEFRFDFFKTVDDVLGLGADMGYQCRIDLPGLYFYLLKNGLDIVDGLTQRQVLAGIPEDQ